MLVTNGWESTSKLVVDRSKRYFVAVAQGHKMLEVELQRAPVLGVKRASGGDLVG